MFNFMKKGTESDRDEKERRKRDKKLRKEAKQGQSAASGSMSSEELLRLDEVRRSLKIRGRRKEKEKLPMGITADYSSFFANIDVSERELDRGTEEILATANTTTYIDSNGDLVEKIHLNTTSIGGGSSFSHSDTSSETSNNSTGNKVS